jgi:hypothetical protein
MDALFKRLKKIKLSHFFILLLFLTILTLKLDEYYIFDLDQNLFFVSLILRLIIILLIIIFCIIKQKQDWISYSLVFCLSAYGMYIVLASIFNTASRISGVVFIHLPFYFIALISFAYTGKNILKTSSWRKVINWIFSYFIITFSICMVSIAFSLTLYYLPNFMPDTNFFDPTNFLEYLFNCTVVIFPFFVFYILVHHYWERSFLKPTLLNLLFLLMLSLMFEFSFLRGFYHIYFVRDDSFLQFFFLCILVTITMLFMFSDLSHRNKINKFLPPIYIIFEIVLLCITIKALNFKLHSQITDNRIAVLIDCYLLLILLIGTLVNYTGFLLKKKKMKDVQKWILSMIPVFLIWIILMSDIVKNHSLFKTLLLIIE